MEHYTYGKNKLAKLTDLSNDELNDLFTLEPLRESQITNSNYNDSTLTKFENLPNLFSTSNCNILNDTPIDSGNETLNTQTEREWIKVKQEMISFEVNSDDKNETIISSSNIVVKNEQVGNNYYPLHQISQDISLNISSFNLNLNAPNIFSMSNVSLTKYSLAPLPPTILRLYNTITSSHSEFSFVYFLSAQLCHSFIPTECFINLKMALLLSIISCSHKTIPIIAIGTDTSSIHSIINEIGTKLSKRFICNQLNDFESVTFTKEKWIEAGPSLLAKNGINYLGDISIINSSTRDRILKEIEDEKICMNIKTANLTFKLESATWCYWNKNLINLKENDKKFLYKFLEVFGIPIAVDPVQSDSLLYYILNQSNLDSCNKSYVSTTDLKDYVSQITNRRIILAKDTSDLLEQYFLTSRSRGRLTQKGFVVINNFAESFAKLTNHKEILLIDAISAIYLAEQSIQQIFGPDIFPSPKFELKQSSNLLDEIDKFMKNFTNWLLWYCSIFKDK